MNEAIKNVMEHFEQCVKDSFQNAPSFAHDGENYKDQQMEMIFRMWLRAYTIGHAEGNLDLAAHIISRQGDKDFSQEAFLIALVLDMGQKLKELLEGDKKECTCDGCTGRTKDTEIH